MRTYLEDGEPILAVKSELYFGFQIRRVKELQNVQIHFSKYRPANYGTITGLLMHMLRNVPHSPVALTGYLRDALRDLHFDTVMDRFGTFFLHELDLEKVVLPDIAQEDTVECLLAMSHVKSLKQIKDKRAMVATPVVDDEGPTEQFPIGNAPTWDEIASTMACNPKLLMSKWAWDDKWATGSTAGRLFTQFTTDYFLTLSTEVVNDVHLPKPKDLKGAMELWTVPSLMALLKDVSFKPSNHGLLGKVPGRRNPSFKDMVDLFFPGLDVNILEKSVWHPFVTRGYIQEFHRTIHSMIEDKISSLLRALGRIFGRIQCLPNAVTCTQKSCGRLWEQSDGGIRMWTNPIFYKIEMVGKAKRTGQAQLEGNRSKQARQSLKPDWMNNTGTSHSMKAGSKPDRQKRHEDKRQRGGQVKRTITESLLSKEQRFPFQSPKNLTPRKLTGHQMKNFQTYLV
jgi:hypothetical protein